ncbi:hypothetical protein [uncultured Piscinibacter sp.]|uniref:hypothetical protein n=1 Tax=uncultured Piscinibacter sp. TaxID=1131835 RepID=UPI00262BD64E|nr:hypothetical protein [uncultured Piscinibacter sp.]
MIRDNPVVGESVVISKGRSGIIDHESAPAGDRPLQRDCRARGSEASMSSMHPCVIPEGNLPDDLPLRIANARGNDGRAVLKDPRVVVPLLGLAQRAPTFDRGDGSLEAQIAAIETLMRDDRQRYFADPALQLRARRLYAQRDAKRL